jgi:hypothetical protein
MTLLVIIYALKNGNFFKIKKLKFLYVFLKKAIFNRKIFAKFRGIISNSATQKPVQFRGIFANSAEFPLIPYSIRNIRKGKKVRNSALTEFRKHSNNGAASFFFGSGLKKGFGTPAPTYK